MNRKENIKDYLMAGNPATAAVKLSRLAHSRYVHIRCRVAENPAASRALLLALSGDIEAAVRIAVADNPNAPLPLLAYLAVDESVDVRFALAENYQLAPNLLRKLAQDENPYVAQRAQRSLKQCVFFRLISASIGGRAAVSRIVFQAQSISDFLSRARFRFSPGNSARFARTRL